MSNRAQMQAGTRMRKPRPTRNSFSVAQNTYQDIARVDTLLYLYLVVERCLYSCRHRLLTIIQVAKPPDRTCLQAESGTQGDVEAIQVFQTYAPNLRCARRLGIGIDCANTTPYAASQGKRITCVADSALCFATERNVGDITLTISRATLSRHCSRALINYICHDGTDRARLPRKDRQQHNLQVTLYSVSHVISIRRMVYMSLK